MELVFSFNITAYVSLRKLPTLDKTPQITDADPAICFNVAPDNPVAGYADSSPNALDHLRANSSTVRDLPNWKTIKYLSACTFKMER